MNGLCVCKAEGDMPSASNHAGLSRVFRPGRRREICGAGCWVILLLFAGPAFSDSAEGLIASPEPDWPQWRGPRRDGISDEKGLLSNWPEGGPKLLWKVEGLGRGWSSPVIVGGRLYITGDVGEDLMVRAFDRKGTPLWRTKNGRAWKGSYPGARACCVFSEGRLYHMNAHGRVAALDAGSGEEIWSVDVLERFGGKNITWALSECLLVDGARVIVTGGGSRALMAALDKSDGRTLWMTQTLGDDSASHCSPILFRYAGRRLISNCSSAHGFGVDADTGELLWTVPLRNPHGVNVSTPVYGSGCVYYVTPYAEHGRCYRLRADGEGIRAKHIWTSPLDTVTGGAVLVDGILYSAGYRRSKWWFGVDWRTGQTKCELKDFTTGASVYADGRLYCLDEQGKVGLLKPGEDGLEVMGRFRLVADRVRDAWAHPVVLDGRLYLRYHETLWCYDIKQP
ncbi:MAG: PQQ-binding-like beta-propeller repeat protein [Phycisphaerales bacterium]|nr:MAG: PQQ-binding-like beta-propeller repeat protein [Phycisphaerales bacterium]